MSGGGTQKVTTNLSFFFFLFQSVDLFQLGSGFEGFFFFFPPSPPPLPTLISAGSRYNHEENEGQWRVLQLRAHACVNRQRRSWHLRCTNHIYNNQHGFWVKSVRMTREKLIMSLWPGGNFLDTRTMMQLLEHEVRFHQSSCVHVKALRVGNGDVDRRV